MKLEVELEKKISKASSVSWNQDFTFHLNWLKHADLRCSEGTQSRPFLRKTSILYGPYTKTRTCFDNPSWAYFAKPEYLSLF